MPDDVDPSSLPALPEHLVGPWSGRVAYSGRGAPFAHRPDEIYCADIETRDAAVTLVGGGEFTEVPTPDDEEGSEWVLRTGGGIDIDDVIEQLRDRGLRAEHHQVLFADGCGCGGWGCGGCGAGANPVYANPVYANPVYANPVYANPVYANAGCAAAGHGSGASGTFANPVYANPVYASPVYANPVYANPVYANAYVCDGKRMTTARPADDVPGTHQYQPASTHRVVILDTGIAITPNCPALLAPLAQIYGGAWGDPPNPSGTYLDPVSGHGTFIAGLIQMLAPDRDIVPYRVYGGYGDADVTTIATAIHDLITRGWLNEHTIINMSFSGYGDPHMRALARWIRRAQRRGAVVVSSAGNDGIGRPTFPACLPGVVGVGALDSCGPAPYSNHGCWVRACAPGTDLVSAFFKGVDGPMPALPGGGDPDKFDGWARWTGTSFSAPVVVAGLLRAMQLDGGTAARAVAHAVDGPGLFRLPGLGTVVNLSTASADCD
jgi:hypothetical protein